MLVKIIISLRNFLQRVVLLCRENVFDVNIFVLIEEVQKNRNFISRYQLDGRLPTEDKPMKKTYFDENLQKFCIDFDQHGIHYNFFDAQKVVSEFLTAFENMFILRPNLRQASFKCTFTIVNRQPASRARFAEITDSRVWQANVYKGMFFNVKANLEGDILKRVIKNGMIGSSWRCKRFDRLCIAINSDQYRGIGN